MFNEVITIYIFIQYTVMQHHQQFTVVTSFTLYSDHALFRIEEKNLYNCLSVKMGRDFIPMTKLDKTC
jgi:hypothetical protein